MNVLNRSTLLLAASAVFLAGCFAPPPAEMASEEEVRHAAIMKKARAVAEMLKTPELALAAGYHPEMECVPNMGVHWLHKPGQAGSYLNNTSIHPDYPEILMFEPDTADLSNTTGDRFVGLEYLLFTEGTSYNSTATLPKLMGEPLDGPMPGHFPGMPWHAELHIYLMPESPSPIGFPGFNEGVKCPAATE
jgi:hypothetical protein